MADELILRETKGEMLTYAELDGNFTYLLGRIEEIENPDTKNAVLYVFQELNASQQQIARNNISALATDMSNLPGNLSAELKQEIREKLGIQESIEITDYVSFSPGQGLNPAEQNNARSNIGAMGVKMSELSGDLVDAETSVIRQKLGITPIFTDVYERLHDLDFNPTTAKPYERYIEHSN